METLVGLLLLALFVQGFMPAVRGTAKGIESFENPGKPETQAEHDQGNSDMLRLLLLIVGVFGLMFAVKFGGM